MTASKVSLLSLLLFTLPFSLLAEEAPWELRALRGAAESAPADADAHVRLGDEYAKAKDGSAALREYRMALDLHPVDVETRLKLGAVLLAGGLLEEAEAEAAKTREMAPQRAEPLALLGRAQSALGRWEEAADAFRQATRLAPDAEDLWVQLSSADAAQGNLAKAEEDLRAGLDAVPPSRAIRAALVDVLEKLGRRAEAEESVEELLHLSPDDRQLHRTAAAYFLRANNQPRAEALLKKALSLAGADGSKRLESLSDLANLYLSARNAGAARAALEESLALAPEDTATLSRLANLYLFTGEVDKARALIEKLVAKGESGPFLAAMELRLGTILEAQDRLGEAFESYERSAAAAPNLPDPVLRQVAILDRLGKREEADRVASSFLRSAGDSAPFLLALSARALEGRRTSLAKNYLSRALPLDGGSAAGRELEARIALVEGDEDRAREALDAAVLASPDRLSSLLLLSGLLAKQGRTAEARTTNERILRLDPENPTAANNLAVIYAEEPQTRPEAVRLARIAASRLPGNPMILDTLGWVQYRIGEYAEALRNLEEANRQLPEEPEVSFHLAAALLRTDKSARGQQLLRRALEKAPQAVWAEEARRLLGASP